MRKVHFTTPSEAADYLREALNVVDYCNVPDDLREVAFTAVFSQIAGAQVFMDENDAKGPVLPAMAIPGSKFRQ